MGNGQVGQKVPQQHALEIRVNSRVANDSVIKVGWCLFQGTLEYLKRTHALRPHVLIVVKPERGREQRFLFPIEQGMGYVPFRAPGRNTLQATIVWSQTELTKHLRDLFFRRHGGAFDTDLLDGNGVMHTDLMSPHYGYSCMEVDVDAHFFAKEPPAWLKAWATFMWDTPVCDECDLRRRMIFAFTLQPILVGVYYGLKFVISLAIALWWWACLGKPGVNFEPVFKPVGAELEDIYGHARYEKTRWKLWTWQVSPIPLMLASLVPLIGLTPKENVKPYQPSFTFIHSSGEFMLYLVAFVVGLYLLQTLAILIMFIIPAIGRVFDRLAEKQARDEATTISRDLMYLECHGEILAPVSVESLPPARRTWRLRYDDLKARVCKPFAA